MSKQTKQPLRKMIRERCQALSDEQIQQASEQLTEHLKTSDVYQAAQRIAFYFPYKKEISPLLLKKHSELQGKTGYLPVIKEDTLCFIQHAEKDPLEENRFGIPEPTQNNRIAIDELDLIFLPLVGFDRQGHRLGQGAGHYDRCLASLRDKEKPKLIGLAHSIQEVEKVPHDDWDIPLHGIATEKDLIFPTLRNFL